MIFFSYCCCCYFGVVGNLTLMCFDEVQYAISVQYNAIWVWCVLVCNVGYMTKIIVIICFQAILY